MVTYRRESSTMMEKQHGAFVILQIRLRIEKRTASRSSTNH